MTLQRLRTVARVGARALVVAGFAGGVWLFSSAAAHASAPAAAPTMKTQPALTPGGEGPPGAPRRGGPGARHTPRAGLPAGPALRPASRSAVPGTRQVPDLPDRAPLPADPGSDTMGISTTASGSGHDAGGYAV